MKFYNVKDEYIQYLKSFDDKVADNKVETRPYVGVVIEINGIKYYAPFASPKPKHRKMKNTKDFRKIKQETSIIIFVQIKRIMKKHVRDTCFASSRWIKRL